VQFAERSRVIRAALTDFFNHIIDVHLMVKYGRTFLPAERPWQISFYGTISAMESERTKTQLDAANTGMVLAQLFAMLKDAGLQEEAMQHFMEKVLRMDVEDAKFTPRTLQRPPRRPSKSSRAASVAMVAASTVAAVEASAAAVTAAKRVTPTGAAVMALLKINPTAIGDMLGRTAGAKIAASIAQAASPKFVRDVQRVLDTSRLVGDLLGTNMPINGVPLELLGGLSLQQAKAIHSQMMEMRVARKSLFFIRITDENPPIGEYQPKAPSLMTASGLVKTAFHALAQPRARRSTALQGRSTTLRASRPAWPQKGCWAAWWAALA
jgi:hypothetical protein